MMRLRGAVLLVTFSLLASAATAYAECAWVLWYDSHLGSIEMVPLKPIGAWSSLKDCELVRKEKLKDTASDPYSSDMPRDPNISDKVQLLENGVSIERSRKATGERFAIVFYRYLCLPDTVDPRGSSGISWGHP